MWKYIWSILGRIPFLSSPAHGARNPIPSSFNHEHIALFQNANSVAEEQDRIVQCLNAQLPLGIDMKFLLHHYPRRRGDCNTRNPDLAAC